MMRYLLLFSTVAFTLIVSCRNNPKREISSQEQVKNYDFKLLENIVTNGALSVEDVLEKLPEEIRRNYTLVHKSNSVQHASAQKPRVVMFSPDGNLILTFNGEPGSPGYNDLETAEFNPNKNTIHFREIEFDPNKLNKPKISESNPRKCTICHGANAAYIWPQYNVWHGMFGQNDDQILKPENSDSNSSLQNSSKQKTKNTIKTSPFELENENEAFLSFQKNSINHPNQSHPRYKFLINTASPYWPYFNALNDRTFGNMPNFRLNTLMQSHFARVVAAQVQRHPHYQNFKWSFFATQFCSAYNSSLKNDKLQLLAKKHLENKLIDTDLYFGFEQWEFMREVYYKNDLAIAYFLDIEPETRMNFDFYSFKGQMGFSGSNNGLDRITELIYYLLLVDEAKKDKSIAKFMSKNPYEVNSYDKYAQGPYPQDIELFNQTEIASKSNTKFKSESLGEFCAYLFESYPKSHAKILQTLDNIKLTPKNSINVQQILEKKCTFCHDGQTFSHFPKIPFHSKQELKKYITNINSLGLGFVENVQSRITTKNRSDHAMQTIPEKSLGHMPHGGNTLSLQEQKALIEYLKKLASN